MKYKFFYSKNERQRFYHKLGYNLRKPLFRQGILKIRAFSHVKKSKKLKLKLKIYYFIKNFFSNKFNYNKFKITEDFLNKFIIFVMNYQKIRTMDRNMVRELINDKIKYFYTEINDRKKLLFLTKLLNKFYINFRKIKIKKRRRLRLKKIFKGKKVYKLVLKHTNSNFFVILTTMKGRVIWYCSSGQVCEFYNIRKKKSHLLVKDMMKRLERRLRYLRIKYLKIFIRSSITRHMQKVMLFLDSKRIKSKYVIFNKPYPHHLGQRRKKLRRI